MLLLFLELHALYSLVVACPLLRRSLYKPLVISCLHIIIRSVRVLTGYVLIMQFSVTLRLELMPEGKLHLCTYVLME